MIDTVFYLTLHHKEIDQDHEQFCHLVLELQNADAGEFLGLFQKLKNHLEQHFEYEKSLMLNSRFPGTDEHIGEHSRILNEVRQFNQRVQQGRITLARAYIENTILDWFNLHVSNMDAALVSHLTAQRVANE